MAQNNNSQLTPDLRPLIPDPQPPTPVVGMVIKIIHYVDDNGEAVTSGPWTIAAVSPTGRTVWTRGGKQVNLDSPAKEVKFYWPDDRLPDPEPIVLLSELSAAEQTEEAA